MTVYATHEEWLESRPDLHTTDCPICGGKTYEVMLARHVAAEHPTPREPWRLRLARWVMS